MLISTINPSGKSCLRYIQILKRFEELGAEFVQIDEPILVTDLSTKDIEFLIVSTVAFSFIKES